MAMVKSVEEFLDKGCGRCQKFDSPECKAVLWKKDIALLRALLLEFPLVEESKWGMPCYSYDGKNIIMIVPAVDSIRLSFLQGVVMNDPENRLVAPGENSQFARYLTFENHNAVEGSITLIKTYIAEAIRVKEQNIPLPKTENSEPVPEELLVEFEENPELETAFWALTKGRQRGYLLHFNGAKQSQTRVNRIQKYKEKILSGKGFHD